ncbi:MAG: cyclin family protein [Zetaproteobacteria bacterium]|nr:cyclin family protein [Zetaproteobacteria bacterium]
MIDLKKTLSTLSLVIATFLPTLAWAHPPSPMEHVAPAPEHPLHLGFHCPSDMFRPLTMRQLSFMVYTHLELSVPLEILQNLVAGRKSFAEMATSSIASEDFKQKILALTDHLFVAERLAREAATESPRTLTCVHLHRQDKELEEYFEHWAEADVDEDHNLYLYELIHYSPTKLLKYLTAILTPKLAAAQVVPQSYLDFDSKNRIFYAQDPNDLSSPDDIRWFLKRFVTAYELPKAVYIMTLIYLERVLDKMSSRSTLFSLHHLNNRIFRRLFTACFAVAAKNGDDCNFMNRDFQRIGGLDHLAEMNDLELRVLDLLGWKLHISRAQLTTKLAEIHPW